jgi:hypothetical protein
MRLIETQLELLVDRLSKIREKLTTQLLERYTQQFQLLANQIPSDRMLERTKILLFSKALPTRLRMLVLEEDEKAGSPGADAAARRNITLNAIVDKILRRSATLVTAAGSASSSHSHSSGSGDAMDLSAVEMCSRVFDVSIAEATRYFESAEGWAPHDTSSSLAATGSSSTQSDREAALARQVSALQEQLNLSATSRRTVAPPVKKEIPEQLAADRRSAGLCVRCGIVKYEPGGKGHNSRTCQAQPDKSTSAAAGAKRAGLPLFQ